MKKSTKFSDLLHLLLHLAEANEPMTSEALARSVKSNPVVVRRTMAGLRDLGFVQSEKGHGGGWRLASELAALTLYDVYQAAGSPTLFAIGNRADNPHCAIERAVNTTTNDAMAQAEAHLQAQFRQVTLGEIYRTMQTQRQEQSNDHCYTTTP